MALGRQLIVGNLEGILVCADDSQIGCGARLVPQESNAGEPPLPAPVSARPIRAARLLEDFVGDVIGCAAEFEFVCPRQWGELEATDQEGVRHCGECNERVYLCTSAEQLREHAEQRHCVARLTFGGVHTVGQPGGWLPYLREGTTVGGLSEAVSPRPALDPPTGGPDGGDTLTS